MLPLGVLRFHPSQIAFDAGQKAVLTSCVLVNQAVLSRKRKKAGGDKVKIRPDAMINVRSVVLSRVGSRELMRSRTKVLLLVYD